MTCLSAFPHQCELLASTIILSHPPLFLPAPPDTLSSHFSPDTASLLLRAHSPPSPSSICHIFPFSTSRSWAESTLVPGPPTKIWVPSQFINQPRSSRPKSLATPLRRRTGRVRTRDQTITSWALYQLHHTTRTPNLNLGSQPIY